ncbi:MAG: hypothetical protein DBY17_08750 [Oscillospiraceae bacterium]|nr:MAG: hypothetical protein DBY17_08750 [Oscillospiraceae bacterium]
MLGQIPGTGPARGGKHGRGARAQRRWNRWKAYCPLLSGSRGGPELCRGEYCAWCTRLEVYPGRVLHSCAVTDIASSLRIIAGK